MLELPRKKKFKVKKIIINLPVNAEYKCIKGEFYNNLVSIFGTFFKIKLFTNLLEVKLPCAMIKSYVLLIF